MLGILNIKALCSFSLNFIKILISITQSILCIKLTLYHFKKVRTFTIHKFYCLVVFDLFTYSVDNGIFLTDLENINVFHSKKVFCYLLL